MGEARDVFNQACADISARFADDGFTYAASSHTFSKKCGDLTFKVRFQSSSRNFVIPQTGPSFAAAISSFIPSVVDDRTVFGEVTLIAHAAVHSKAFKRWRTSIGKPLGTDDSITGGQLGNLKAKPEWIMFNLANPHRRDATAMAVVGLIREVALPYFERFFEPDRVIDGLIDDSFPFMWEPSALEYALCFGSRQRADDLLRRYLGKRPEQMDDYQRLLREYRSNGIPEAFCSTAPGRLAKAALALGLA